MKFDLTRVSVSQKIGGLIRLNRLLEKFYLIVNKLNCTI